MPPIYGYDPTPYDAYFQASGAKYGIDPGMLRTQAGIESNFNPRAVSPKGAMGISQFMRATGGDYGLVDDEDFFNPEKSIAAQAQYMRVLIDRYNGDEQRALSAYNAGMGNIERHGAYDWDEPKEYRRRYNERYVLPPSEARDPSLLSGGGGSGPEKYEDYVSRLRAESNPQPEQRAGVEDNYEDYIAQLRAGSNVQQPENMEVAPYEEYMAGLRKDSQPDEDKLDDVSLEARRLGIPLGSQAMAEHVTQYGGKPSLTPSRVLKGSPYAGSELDKYGNQIEQDYPIHYKARILKIEDADTIQVREMGTGEERWIRLPDIDAPESDTPEGAAAEADLMSRYKVGTQVTVTTKGSEWKGKYDRPLGKVFLPSMVGHVVDMSAPDDLTGELTTYEGVDAGAIGTLISSAMREAPELMMLPEDIYDWVADGDPDENSKIYQWADGLDAKWHQRQIDFVTGDYDPDRTTYDLPFVGNVSVGELIRAGSTATAYAFGIAGVAGKAVSAIRAGRRAATMMRQVDSIAAGTASAKDLARIRKTLINTLGNTEDSIKVADDIIGRAAKSKGEGRQIILDHMPANKGETMVQWTKRFAKTFVAHTFDQYTGLTRLGKAAGKVEFRELTAYLNQLHAGDEFARSMISNVTTIASRGADGTVQMVETGEALTDVFQGVEMDDVDAVLRLMTLQMATKVEIPRFTKWMGLAGGDLTKAQKMAKDAGEKFVDFDLDEIPELFRMERELEDLYRVAGKEQHAQLLDKATRARSWLQRATFDQIVDVGGINAKGKQQVMEYMESWFAPWGRHQSDDFLVSIIGQDAVDEIKTLEQLSQTVAEVKKARGSLGRPKADPVPLHGRKHGLGGGRRKVVNPLDQFIARGVAINKWATRQRVRNLTGDMLMENPHLMKGVNAITDARAVKQLMKHTPDDVMVAFHKQADGSVQRIAYQFDDPSMIIANKALQPTQADTLHKMLKFMSGPTSVFRKGTVLGLNFMLRNPIRDQFMAATLSKYGYKPVLSFWRGMAHVITKSDFYNTLKASGGGQSTHVGNIYQRTKNFEVDIGTGERLSDISRLGKDPDPIGVVRDATVPFGIHRTDEPMSLLAKRFKGSYRGYVSDMSKKTSPEVSRFDRWLAPLAKISEALEEGTRVGAAAGMRARMKKGKRMTLMAALDDAAGGATGWGKMLYSRKARKGFFGRVKEARFLDDATMERLAKSNWVDSAVIDEMRNITLDFARHGKYGEALNGLYPFFNAELQDMWRFTKAMKESPLSTMTKAFTYITIPAIANWYLNFDDPNYQAQSEIEKDLYLHPFGFDSEYKKFGRIPRPLGMVNGVFGLAAHKFMDYIAANDPAMVRAIEEMLWPGGAAREARDNFQETMYETKKGVHEEMGGIPQALVALLSMGMATSPTGQGGGAAENQLPAGDPLLQGTTPFNYLKEQVTEYATTNMVARYAMPTKENTLGATLAPQFIAPLLHINANWDPFFKAPIVPPRFMTGELQPQDIYTESTTPMERSLSKMLNHLTPEALNINPIQMGYLIRRYTGSLGAGLMTTADMGMQDLGLIPERPSHISDITDRPGAGGLYGREPFGSNSAPVRELYDQWEMDKKVLGSMQYNQAAMRPERIRDIVHKHPEFVPAQLLETATKQLSAMHKARRAIRADESLTQETRVDQLFQLDQAMTTYAYQIMNAYLAMRTDPDLMMQISGLLGD